MQDLINPAVAGRIDEIRDGFAQAEPFRHCVIDGFLDDGFAQRLLERFPDFERGNHLNEDGHPGGKSTHERMRDQGGEFAILDELVRSREFLAMVGRITGIPDLLYDPMYFGGGTHENRQGQALDVHIDFNHHPLTRWHRRLNLIVYLNPGWQPEWGGALELHRDPYDAGVDEVVEVLPLFNRCVIFETTERSWHGFRRITLPPERAGATRRSVALYFYTEERPAAETGPTHSTVYVDRTLPDRFVPGYTLTRTDRDELDALVTSQNGHTRRLYREIERLQAELESTALNRVAGALRQRWARYRMRRGAAR
ncbi:2OG-Fe(II) oxygenase [Pseudoxanthomonas daejeonensis]|uniref:2OG-Fe(II) oxygenase n=1 Tax=Pseudoxanthomonas daejeonensis TaxID=266062 RepID=UPI001F547EF5|nr:2OG-Fe(II) oxygenase [Pseudoxanthomonas daejeonensis]UNK56866.1 2OG-Fe(II) oxygenase [Pseudoxanthomonas daejeonensis]